jgi:hypothetical protein
MTTSSFVYSFAFQLNYIVSPWIAFALLIHQLLLVAEVFQLVLVSVGCVFCGTVWRVLCLNKLESFN